MNTRGRFSSCPPFSCRTIVFLGVLGVCFTCDHLQLRDVRRELQDTLRERDVAIARGARVDDLEETVSELRRQNKDLEDQVGIL